MASSPAATALNTRLAFSLPTTDGRSHALDDIASREGRRRNRDGAQ